MKHVVYVYGTLRPGWSEPVRIPGQIFDLGRFPGLRMDLPGEVVCEKVEIEDLASVDRYEGYRPDDEPGSLYIRRPFRDGWIYEFSRSIDGYEPIESGDWLAYTKEKQGSYGGSFR